MTEFGPEGHRPGIYGLNFDVIQHGGSWIVAGNDDSEVTKHNSPRLGELLTGALGDADCQEVIVDLSKVGFFDSTGLTKLVEARRLAQMDKKGLSLYVTNPAHHKLLETTGLKDHFYLRDNLPPVE